MNKARITNKELREEGCPIVFVRENDFKILFDYSSPLWYTAGKYGWNADYWMTDCNLIFTQGERPYYTDKLSDFLLIKDKYQKIDAALYTEKREARKLNYEEFAKRVIMYRNALAQELYTAIQANKED